MNQPNPPSPVGRTPASDIGRRPTLFSFLLAAVLALLPVVGCGPAEDKRVVVLYTSVDEPVSRPIVEAFEKEYDVRVVLKTDAEATKTVGLAERIRAERDNPQCDVYWGNEVFNTVALAEDGLLTGYESPAMKEIPPPYKDAGFRWAGAGLRARVIAVSRQQQGGVPPVKGLEDLLNPAFKGKVALARPTAGTTGGHVAALYAVWGKDKADEFFRKLKANEAKLVGGNSVVAQMVGSGQMLVGLTDNDDVVSAKADGGKLEQVLPDQDAIGTLTMPTTVGLVAGAPHRPTAQLLIDYLLSPEVEQRLISAGFAAYAVRAAAGPDGVKPMQVDYAAVAKVMPAAIQSATAILEGRQ